MRLVIFVFSIIVSMLSTRVAAWHRAGAFSRRVLSLPKPNGCMLSSAASPATSAQGQGQGGGKRGLQATQAGAVLPLSDHITPQKVDYSAWYSDVLRAADLVDNSPVRGCMVIKPWGMAVWDLLRSDLDSRITASGANNAYFPLLIPRSFLAKEAQHIDGFAKECAVVTHHRLITVKSKDAAGQDKVDLVPDPAAKLEEPLIIRPTSETIIWDMFGKWINSYRDLPLKINQWANVVRWELRSRPFLRSSEFLWQEGHTAHATEEEARGTAREMLDLYASVCHDALAIPVTKGVKSPAERFAGADDTFTIEAQMLNGWALQSGTSHFLGQSFAKAFDVRYQSADGGRELVWATSWGVSTRLIGALIMSHSDDLGLVLPPRVAPQQVVVLVIPDMKKKKKNESGGSGNGSSSGDNTDAAIERAKEIVASLKRAGIRARVDDRSHMRLGPKHFEWERKGVPLRIEVGARDVAAGQVVLVTRWNGEKRPLQCDASSIESGALAEAIGAELQGIQAALLQRAEERVKARTWAVRSYDEMKSMMVAPGTSGDGDGEGGGGDESEGEGSQVGFYLVPWTCDSANEAAIQADCKATIRCYPLSLNQSPPPEGTKCFYSGRQATHIALFARAY